MNKLKLCITSVAGIVSVSLIALLASGCGDSGSGTSDVTYIIVVTSGNNGTISPSGDVEVKEGDDQSFTIIPDEQYIVHDVLVDGVSMGAVTSYTFSNVKSVHTISATFSVSHELLGTWDMTQTIMVFGNTPIDTLTPGVDTVSGTITFNENSICNYNFDFDTSISISGDWSTTDSSFTINDSQAGEQTFLYEITGNTMVTTGTIATSIVDLVLIQTWKKQ